MAQGAEQRVAVEVRGLSFAYREGLFGRGRPALCGVDLVLPAGAVGALVGPNGSGKTTLLRCLSGELRGRAARAAVLGRAPGDRRARARIGVVEEGALPFDRLRARELLELHGALIGLSRAAARARAETLLADFGLTALAERRHRGFSAGEARRLALALALVPEPELLLLDEPVRGLDPDGLEALRRLLAAQRARGGSALVATHAFEELADLCDLIFVLESGRLVAAGPPAEVLARPGRWLLEVHAPKPPERAAARAALAPLGLELADCRPARASLAAWLAARRRGSSADG